MDSSGRIPGFNEIAAWPTRPSGSLSLKDHGFYRDPGPHCTHYVHLVDGEGKVYPFFFERFLGRLCYGATDESGDDAAFVKPESPLANEVFAVLLGALKGDSTEATPNDRERLQAVVARALLWSPG